MIDGDGRPAVREEEALLTGRHVLLERALDHHAAEPVGTPRRPVLGHELRGCHEVDDRLPDTGQDEGAERHDDDRGAEKQPVAPAHPRSPAGTLRAPSSSVRMPDSTRHQ